MSDSSCNSVAPDLALKTQILCLVIKGHAAIVARHASEPGERLERMRQLVHGFRELYSRLQLAQIEDVAARCHSFAALIGSFRAAFDSYRQGQQDRADDFNILEVMNLTYKEIRHSMMLAWLLDHDLRRRGTHAQGSLGFRLFLAEFGLPLWYADERYWVRREAVGQTSIIDVEIGSRSRFLIHIEIKVWAAEGIDQTEREWDDLSQRAVELGVDPESPNPRVHALYLTPSGVSPISPRFRPVSWLAIARILERFSAMVAPQDVKLFSAHYARALRRYIATEPPAREVINGEGIDE
jgi:hypothetical protein